MAYTSAQTSLKSTQANGLSSLIETAKMRFAKHRMYRRTVNELSGLSDRELADLGLHRSVIRRIAIQAADEQFSR